MLTCSHSEQERNSIQVIDHRMYEWDQDTTLSTKLHIHVTGKIRKCRYKSIRGNTKNTLGFFSVGSRAPTRWGIGRVDELPSRSSIKDTWVLSVLSSVQNSDPVMSFLVPSRYGWLPLLVCMDWVHTTSLTSRVVSFLHVFTYLKGRVTDRADLPSYQFLRWLHQPGPGWAWKIIHSERVIMCTTLNSQYGNSRVHHKCQFYRPPSHGSPGQCFSLCVSDVD